MDARTVKPGDRLKFPARTKNRLDDLLRDDVSQNSQQRTSSSVISIVATNGFGSDILRGAPALVTLPTATEIAAQRKPDSVVGTAAPYHFGSSGTLGIAMEEIEDGKPGRFAIAGLVYVRTSGTGGFLAPHPSTNSAHKTELRKTYSGIAISFGSFAVLGSHQPVYLYEFDAAATGSYNATIEDVNRTELGPGRVQLSDGTEILRGRGACVRVTGAFFRSLVPDKYVIDVTHDTGGDRIAKTISTNATDQTVIETTECDDGGGSETPS